MQGLFLEPENPKKTLTRRFRPYFSGCNNFMDMPTHWHDFYEIMLVLVPNFRHTLNGVTDAPKRGDVIILRPSVDAHSAVPIDPGKPVLVRDIAVEPDLFRSTCDALHPTLFGRIETAAAPPQFYLSESSLMAVEEFCHYPFFEENDKLLSGDEPDQIHMMKRAMLSFILGKYVQMKFYDAQHTPECILRLTDFLHDRDFVKLSVEEMAYQLGYSRTYLSQEFKKIYGVSIKRFLMLQRLSNAAVQLSTTDMSVTEIMRDNGWKKPSNFYDAFREVYQTDPKTYRSIHRQKK
ncbi:MAG: helix-turn-helix domain-containing protein [Clostridia bacterium]|nr:helix-turn-helix domain-containing protein [Clostridia bacterium]MBR0510076.1 helix-turn-helix domain-containing protein [Clostridia bacterium]